MPGLTKDDKGRMFSIMESLYSLPGTEFFWNSYNAIFVQQPDTTKKDEHASEVIASIQDLQFSEEVNACVPYEHSGDALFGKPALDIALFFGAARGYVKWLVEKVMALNSELNDVQRMYDGLRKSQDGLYVERNALKDELKTLRALCSGVPWVAGHTVKWVDPTGGQSFIGTVVDNPHYLPEGWCVWVKPLGAEAIKSVGTAARLLSINQVFPTVIDPNGQETAAPPHDDPEIGAT